LNVTDDTTLLFYWRIIMRRWISVLLLLVGCDEGDHGEASVCEENGVDTDAECFSDSAVVQCGPGTVEVDGECVPAETSCGFGTVIEGEECVALASQTVYLPFAAETATGPRGSSRYLSLILLGRRPLTVRPGPYQIYLPTGWYLTNR
jgi:hypothetical protein